MHGLVKIRNVNDIKIRASAISHYNRRIQMFHVPAHKNTDNPPAQTYPASEFDDLEWELQQEEQANRALSSDHYAGF
jgi:hypothetical protein